MSNAEKVNEILDKAKTFFFLTTDGDKPKGRPFGFHMLVDGKIYFACGTFKNVYKQMEKNPHVEIVALVDDGIRSKQGRLLQGHQAMRQCQGGGAFRRHQGSSGGFLP